MDNMRGIIRTMQSRKLLTSLLVGAVFITTLAPLTVARAQLGGGGGGGGGVTPPSTPNPIGNGLAGTLGKCDGANGKKISSGDFAKLTNYAVSQGGIPAGVAAALMVAFYIEWKQGINGPATAALYKVPGFSDYLNQCLSGGGAGSGSLLGLGMGIGLLAAGIKQFGGKIQEATLCTCSQGTYYLVVGPPTPANVLVVPGTTRIYAYGRYQIEDIWVLGNYVQGGACLMYSGNSCKQYGAPQGTAISIGTGAVPDRDDELGGYGGVGEE